MTGSQGRWVLPDDGDDKTSCRSSHDGDSSFRDCASFCSNEYRADHCDLCKCKACGFCSCSSDVADDSAEETCAIRTPTQ